MNSDALLAYFHFLAIIGMAAMLSAEFAALAHRDSATDLRRLKRLDGMYGLFAMLTLASGIARLLWGAKGSAFYLSNPVFHTKLTLFVVAALLSIYPTIQYFKWAELANADARFCPPAQRVARVRSLIITQLVLLAAIPLAATLMARGVGAS